MLFKSIFLFISFFISILADTELTEPKSGDSFSATGGDAEVTLKWKEDSDADSDFSLKQVKSFSVLLCTGSGSYPIECFDTLVDGEDYTDETSYDAKIPDDTCDDGYYFFQLYFSYGQEKAVIHYSNRFRLRNMKGSTKTLTVDNTYTNAPPPDQTSGMAATDVDSKSFSITYTKQTGKTRYAPMQTQPASKVTAKEWSRLYPTSAVSYFSTKYQTPSIRTTITPGWSYTIKSLHNWATVAPTPSNKYDPKERVTPASLSTANKKRRWLD